jgi:WD40 repeat protein
MGGVGGALAQHAEETLAALPVAEHARVREAFRQLTTAEGTRAVLPRGELAPLCGDAALERLVGARLLAVSDEDNVEIAHEALLDAWPRLRAWRREDQEGARLRDQLRAAARAWAERGRPRGLLWTGDAADELRRWRARDASPLAATEEQFALASRREATRRRRRLLASATAAFVALAAVAAVLFVLARRARTSAAELSASLTQSYEDRGRDLMLAGDVLRGLAYLNAAYQRGADDAGLHFLLARGLEALGAGRAVLTHPALVHDLFLTKDGRRVVTAGADGHVRVWALGGDLLVDIAAHRPDDGFIFQIAPSPDGTMVASAGADSTAKVWRLDDGALVRSFQDDRRVRAVAFADDGATLVTAGSAGIVRSYDVATGEKRREMRHGAIIHRLVLDGDHVITGGEDGRVVVFDASGAVVHERKVGDANIDALAVRHGRVAASAGGMVAVFDAASGATLASIAPPRAVLSLALDREATLLATGNDDGLTRLWAVDGGALRGELGSVGAGVTALRMCGAEEWIVSGTSAGLHVWTGVDAQPRSVLVGHANFVSAIDCDDAGEVLVSSSADRSARVWDGRVAAVRRAPTSSPGLTMVDVSPDGARAVTTGVDGEVAIWQIDGWRRLATLPKGEGVPSEAVFGVDADHVLVMNQEARSAWMWRLEGVGARLEREYVGPAKILHAEASRDGRRVVTAGEDGVARLFDAASGEPLRAFTGHQGNVLNATFSPDGARIATAGSDGTARIWEVGSDSALVLRGHAAEVVIVTFDRRGERLLTSSLDGTARIWDVASGAQLTSLGGHGALVLAAAFDDAGALVATVTMDGVLRVWDAATGQLVESVPAHAGRAEQVVFRHGADEVLTCGLADARVAIWPTSRDRRSRAAIADVVRCQVPFELVGDRLVPVVINQCK